MVTLAAVHVPELRPLGVGEILDVALKIWRRHFSTLARIVVVIVVPLEILSSLLITSVTPDDELIFDPATGAETFDGGDAAAFLAAILIAFAISGVGFLLSSAATLRAVSVAYLGGEPHWRESVRTAFGRLGGLIGLAVLMGFGLAIAFLMLIIPGIWLAVAWSLAPAVLVAEGRGGAAALRRSFALVRGRWWPTFGVLLLAFILKTTAEQVIALPFGLLSPEPGSFGAFVGLSISSITAAVITTPFVSAVFVLVYFDLRVRKEGFDLELLVRALDSPGDGPGPSGWSPQNPVAQNPVAQNPVAQGTPPAGAPRPRWPQAGPLPPSPVDPSWPPPTLGP